MSVWLHGDDAGSTRAVTDRILGAWSSGLLDGFGIIANGEACETVRGRLRRSAGRPCRLAVHLNLSEGKSLVPPKAAGLLVDAEGRLRLRFERLFVLWLMSSGARRRALLGQVTEEWRAQIRRVQDIVLPRAVDVVDSHIHVHMLPFLMPIAARLAREAGIPAVRLSRERFYLSSRWSDSARPRFLANILKYLTLRACAAGARKLLHGAGLRHPDSIIGVLYSGFMSVESARSGIQAALRKGSRDVEVIFHIGRAEEAECRTYRPASLRFYLDESRDREFRALGRLRKETSDGG